MSKEDTYFTIPLAMLRSGESALDVLEAACSYGTVSAGIGYRAIHGDDKFNALVAAGHKEEDSDDGEPSCPRGVVERLWEAALAGAQVLGIKGGRRSHDARVYYEHHEPGQVFFSLRSDWMWNALDTARRETNEHAQMPAKPLFWPEFRLLAAVLSAQTNTRKFTFLGWESLQARACGYHSKELFQVGKAGLPAHCQPLSRHTIRQTMDRLEALGFFARCRYASGPRGGCMAYSFRHPKRGELATAVKDWRATKDFFKTKAAANRAADLEAFQKKAKETGSCVVAIAAALPTPVSPRHDQATPKGSPSCPQPLTKGGHQPGHQPPHQHKKKGLEGQRTFKDKGPLKEPLPPQSLEGSPHKQQRRQRLKQEELCMEKME